MFWLSCPTSSLSRSRSDALALSLPRHRHSLYAAYHSHHHASFVSEPVTGSVHPFGNSPTALLRSLAFAKHQAAATHALVSAVPQTFVRKAI